MPPRNILTAALRLALLSATLWTSGMQADEAWELPPRVEVDAQGLFVDRLFANPNAASLAQVRLADAPAWGETRRLTREEARQLLAKAVPNLTPNLTGSPQVLITRRSQKLTESDLLRRLTDLLVPNRDPDRDGELELRLTREWKPLSVPAEDIELRILDKPASGLPSNLMVRFEIRSGSETLGTFTVFLQARLFRQVWVARSAIKRGTSVDAADLTQERRDVINLQPVWQERTLDSTYQFREGVPASGIVFARAIQRRPVVLRGQFAQATVKDDALSVSTKVELLEDGAPGQTVKARNPRTKKVIEGRVTHDGTLEILF